MELLAHLNPHQREAVLHQRGPLLILAGAGSGKTRVITARIAHLVEQQGVGPEQILAVTFTNKAAQEMQERVHALLQHRPDAPLITISTFHSLGARLLRRHARLLGLTPQFHIHDDDDQLRLIRQLLPQGDSDRSEPRRLQHFIDQMKNRALTPEQAHQHAVGAQAEENARFYERYQQALRQANCVDFGDLNLAVVELFRAHPDLASRYSRLWQYVMVDEFQDTNHCQYELLAQLTSAHDNLAVVGDDDQSIYHWRGATVANILGFERRHEDVTVVRLEQNYRSSQVILDAAHDVIQHNPERHDKRLWTERQSGDPIHCFVAVDDREEAAFVAQNIEERVARGANYLDFAVFYRTNAQGRLFEEHLRAHHVPYRLVGGTSFYAREEIKDVLAYLKAAVNPANDVAVRRVINTPGRGVGKATIEKIAAVASIDGVGSFFQALELAAGQDVPTQNDLFDRRRPRPRTDAEHRALAELEGLRGSSLSGIRSFLEVVQAVRDDLIQFESLATVLEHLLERLHYAEYLEQSDPERAEDKRQNVEELINALAEFERDADPEALARAWEDDAEPAGEEPAPGNPAPPARSGRRPRRPAPAEDELLMQAPSVTLLRAFLERCALVQEVVGEDAGKDSPQGTVTLMTVHGSKGLEFDTVFVAGLEDGLFPSRREGGDPNQLSEERRLAYVAITRARNNLFLTWARRRRIHGRLQFTKPSPFLLDIDPARLHVDPRSSTDGPSGTTMGGTSAASWAQPDWSQGDEVSGSFSSAPARPRPAGSPGAMGAMRGAASGGGRRGQGPGQGFSFFGQGVDPGLWEFDQTGEMERGSIRKGMARMKNAPPVDEMNQLNPDAGDFSQASEGHWHADEAPLDFASEMPPDLPIWDAESVRQAPGVAHGEQRLVGMTASHVRFGLGRIVGVSGFGEKARLTVDFVGGGQQTVIRKFLKIMS